MRKAHAIVVYKDGTQNMEAFKLEDDLPFGLDEMEKWVKKKDSSIEKIIWIKKN